MTPTRGQDGRQSLRAVQVLGMWPGPDDYVAANRVRAPTTTDTKLWSPPWANRLSLPRQMTLREYGKITILHEIMSYQSMHVVYTEDAFGKLG